MIKRRNSIIIAIILAIIFTSACSIKKMAMNQVANALTTGSSKVFTGDNDPELIGAALPFAIKMYESLMDSIPWHNGLKLKTGSMYIMYANAFIQTPADMLSAEELEKQRHMFNRAKNLYLRGRDIIMLALESKHKGFLKKIEEKKFKEALTPMKKEDVPYLYWAALGWLGGFAIEPLDMELGITVPGASALMQRVFELEPGYDNGAIYDFYVTFYGSMPSNMGGDAAKARESYKKAVEASHGKRTSPHLSLATSVSVNEQNKKEFLELLDKVLEVNLDADPENRLVNILNQNKASWLKAHVDDFFVGDEVPEQEQLPATEEVKQEETKEEIK